MSTDTKIKAFLVDALRHRASVVEFEDSLLDLYSMLNCDRIDITVASVGATEFDIICDDDGLLKAEPITTAVYSKCDRVLVGSLLFCHHDKKGYLASITNEDILTLTSHITSTYNLVSGGMDYVVQPAICID